MTDDPSLPFTQSLRDAAQPHWDRTVGHRFVRELAADDMSEAAFARYLVQDYAFIGALADLVAYGAAFAPTMAAKNRLAQFLAMLTSEENDFFQRSFEALSVPQPLREAPKLTPPAKALAAIFQEVQATGSYAEVLAAFLPAEWCYLAWAKTCPPKGDPARPKRFWAEEWITLHDQPAFEAFVGWLRAETERVGASVDSRTQARMQEIFIRVMEQEVAFFDEAYRQN